MDNEFRNDKSYQIGVNLNIDFSILDILHLKP